MVMRRATDFLGGGSNPGEVNMPPAPAPKEYRARGSNQRPLPLQPATLPFDQQWGSYRLLYSSL